MVVCNVVSLVPAHRGNEICVLVICIMGLPVALVTRNYLIFVYATLVLLVRPSVQAFWPHLLFYLSPLLNVVCCLVGFPFFIVVLSVNVHLLLGFKTIVDIYSCPLYVYIVLVVLSIVT